MKKLLLATLGFIAFHQSVFSMTYDDALLNLFYFEHASVSSAYCERNSFSTEAVLARWQEKHQMTRREIFNVIQLKMVERGLTKKESDIFLAAAIEANRNAAQKHNANKMPQCQKFDLQLKMYSDLMVQ